MSRPGFVAISPFQQINRRQNESTFSPRRGLAGDRALRWQDAPRWRRRRLAHADRRRQRDGELRPTWAAPTGGPRAAPSWPTADPATTAPSWCRRTATRISSSTSSSGSATTPTAASTCAAPHTRPMTDRTCYEANIFDRRPDPSYGTGAIVHLAPVSPMPKAGGKWNTYDITRQGHPHDGRPERRADDPGRPMASCASGPVALQYAGGVVKFRKVQIKPL